MAKCIDVSQNNGKIDWQKVKKAGVDSVFIRVGGRYYKSGLLYKDTRAEENITNAFKNGLNIGLYFYSKATTLLEARAEADELIKVANKYKDKISLPLALDSEIDNFSTDRFAKISKTVRTSVTIEFLERIKKAGYTPLLYCNKSHLTSLLESSKLTNYDKWLAWWSESKPNLYNLAVWQYSEKGRVDGIKGDVDLNVLYKYYKMEIDFPDDIKIKAVDVLFNKYGTGETRKKKLGADYTKVQALVNKLIEIIKGV